MEPTDSALALYASWVATGARDRGLSLLDAWPQPPASAAPPTNATATTTTALDPGAPPSPLTSTALPAAAPPPGSTPPPGRVFRLEVGVGEMAILPGGWPYAAAAASDCVAVCGHLLHAHALAAQLRCWELEDLLRVRHRARFPLFRHVMWHAAVYYNRVLRSAAGGAGEGKSPGRRRLPGCILANETGLVLGQGLGPTYLSWSSISKKARSQNLWHLTHLDCDVHNCLLHPVARRIAHGQAPARRHFP